jgi:CubicO group peptidase (beta-lactamase class C family)
MMTTRHPAPPHFAARPRLTAAIVAFVALTSSASLRAQPPSKPADRVAQRLQAEVQAGHLSGAAYLLLDAQGRRAEGYFGRYHAGTRIPIGGASQWLAAATLLRLADAGRLDLDDPLIRFFPAIREDKAPITVRQLLSHRAGLEASHLCLGDGDLSLEACAEAILQRPLRSLPGTQSRFSEAGYQVAARVAEIILGRSWQAIFEEQTAGPLGLTQTAFAPAENPRIAAGALSTLAEFSLFLDALRAKQKDTPFLSKDALQAMFTAPAGASRGTSPLSPEPGRFGLGVWIPATDQPFESPGLLGFFPWLTRDRSRAGLLMTQAPPETAEQLRQELLPLLQSIRLAARDEL